VHRKLLIALTITGLVLGTVPATATTASSSTSQGSAEAYSGTHVTFETTSNSVANYSVGDAEVLSSVKVQSQSSAENGGFVDGSHSSMTSLEGFGLTLESQTTTSATVSSEGSASMEAHDNANGILVVESGSDSQYVLANMSGSATASAESDSQVAVTTDDGTEGTFIVVGDGSVTVNDEGDVSASLESESTLVFRAYQEGSSEDTETEEELIANGTAAAEVHVMEQDGETVDDVVTYGQDTSVEVTEKSEGTVKMTADRSKSEGKIIITSVTEAVIESADDLDVTVGGSAAAEASSYSELQGAIGSDSSKYMVSQATSADAGAKALVAVNEFSEKEVEMSSDGSSSGGGLPGFGTLTSIVAFAGVGVALLARRRYDS